MRPPCYDEQRRNEPFSFAELVTIALAFRAGDLIADIAIRLRRPRSQIRSLIWRDPA